MKKDINKIEKVQRVADEFIVYHLYRHSTPDNMNALLLALSWESLKQHHHKALLGEVYKMVEGHVVIPDTYHSEPKHRNHTKFTNSKQFFHKQANILWNQLPHSVVTATSMTSSSGGWTPPTCHKIPAQIYF